MSILRRMRNHPPSGDGPRASGLPFALDTPLLQFPPADMWTIGDACEGVQIFGAVGSGKTSGSGAAIAEQYLMHGFGGLVLCATPGERKLWEGYARTAGRSSDLVIFSPDHPWRFNFLDYELRRESRGGGLTENLVNLLSVVVEIVEGKQQMAAEGGYWDRAMRELVRNAIDLLALGQGTITLEDLTRFIASAPQSPEQVASEQWREQSFCASVIRKAAAREKSTRQAHDYRTAGNYWTEQFPVLADRHRSSIVATFTSVADVLNHGIAWELMATETSIIPEVTYKNGAVVILDLPIQEFGELGRIIQGIWKYMFQRAILRRNAETDPRPAFLWVDEAQNFISPYDFKYQSEARKHRGCTVYLTQNISNYYAVLGSGSQAEANSLLGNFQTKIFHANSDHPTNQWAADTIAQAWRTTTNYGNSYNEQGRSISAGGSESVQYKVLPGHFTTLRTGGYANAGQVDAILFRNGRVWNASGDTYLPTVFQQRSQ